MGKWRNGVMEKWRDHAIPPNVARTGAWSLVPTSFCTGHEVACAASDALAKT